MICSNIPVLLAERRLKITKVSKDTGISRTTLTSLASNKSQGIYFDTFNTLCSYLNVSPEQLFKFFPYDFDFNIEGDFLLHPENGVYINITATGQKKKFIATFAMVISIGYSDKEETIIDLIDIDVILPPMDDEGNSDASFICKLITELLPIFKMRLSDDLLDLVMYEWEKEFAHEISCCVTWFKDN